MGWTAHISPLRMKLLRLCRRHPGDAHVLEDWLVDVANARGARIVRRNLLARTEVLPPSVDELSDTELTIGLLLTQNLDRPQILRLAAQLISAGAVVFEELMSLAIQEREESILSALAKQALHVEPKHAVWLRVAEAIGTNHVFKQPLLHYTRLAEPVPVNGRVNAQSWKLVA